MKPILCPSMMCADYNSLQTEVRRLNETEADIFHVDVMDGSFVPNYAMGLEDLKCIRKNTDKKVDVHLMVDTRNRRGGVRRRRGRYHLRAPGDGRPHRQNPDRIRNMGIAPGIAINPGTSIESIIELLPLVDYILVMTVNPGFAGQKYLDFVNGKIRNLAEFKDEYGFKLMADGAISPEKITELSKMGVDGFVLGTSSLFGKAEEYDAIIGRLKKLA